MEPSAESRPCLNCGSPLPEGARFCPECGQKDTDGRITIGQVFSDFFSSLFNLEYAIFPTLRDLFIPGKLTTAYFEGKHKSYVAPVRLFFIITLLLVAAVSAVINFEEIAINGNVDDFSRDIFKREFTTALDTAQAHTRRQFSSPEVDQALDTLREQIPILAGSDPGEDSLGVDGLIDLGYMEIEGFKIAKKDFVELSPDELLEKYKIEGFTRHMLLKQTLKSMKDSRSFTRYLIGKILWLALLMLPALALFMKLLYIRRNFYYVEHLVFNYHTHSFLFLILSLGIFLRSLIPPSSWAILIVGYFLYLFVAFRRFYRQGFFKTFLKLFILSIVYFILIIVFLVIVLLIGFVLF